MPARIKPISFEPRRNSLSFSFFTRGGCASYLRACLGAWLLPQSYQYPNLSEGADRVGGQLRGYKDRVPLQWRNQIWPSFFSFFFLGRCMKAMLGVWIQPRLTGSSKRKVNVFNFTATRELPYLLWSPTGLAPLQFKRRVLTGWRMQFVRLEYSKFCCCCFLF